MTSETLCSCPCCRAIAERPAAAGGKHDAVTARLHAAAVVLDTALGRQFGDRDDVAAFVDTPLLEEAMDDLWSVLTDLALTTHEADDPFCNCIDCLQASEARQEKSPQP